MLRRPLRPLLALLPLLVLLPAVRAEEPSGGPATVTVARRSLHVTLALSGTFVPDGAVDVAYRPEVYAGKLEVVEAAALGPVVSGQTLVRFDEAPYLEEKANRQRDLDLARLKLKRQEEEARQRAVTAEINRKGVAERLRRAEEGFVRYREIDKPLKIQQAEFGLQGSADRLQDEREELAQLEKMYQADDLTEETEEIVMRRARRGLARLETSFAFQKQRHQQLLEIEIPREEMDLALELERRRQEFDAHLALSENDRVRVELELDKARSDLVKQEKQYRDFLRDGESLRLTAPADGFAVPGEFAAGAWKDVEASRRALQPGNTVKPEQVLFTIVRRGDVDVRAVVAEADLLRVKVGQRVEVVPGTDPERKLDGEVGEILPVGSGGKHALSVALKGTFPGLLPGQSCALTVLLRRAEDALTVPAEAVRRTGDRTEVFVVAADGTNAARAVRLGEKGEGHYEVLEGLAEGDKVLARPPEGGK